MESSIWDVLGIEPTNDKKMIQQAYSNKLKKYHPEENPEEFQKVQDAYRSAIAYTKNQVVQNKGIVVNTKPFIAKEMKSKSYPLSASNQPKIVSTETEQIPDYIQKIGEADIHDLKSKDIVKYVEILKEQLMTKKGSENKELLVSLFDNIAFRNTIGLDEFLICLKREMNDVNKWNKRAINILLAKIKDLKHGQIDYSYKEVIKYLESKKGLSSVQIVLLVIFACIIRAVVYYFKTYY